MINGTQIDLERIEKRLGMTAIDQLVECLGSPEELEECKFYRIGGVFVLTYKGDLLGYDTEHECWSGL